MNKMSLDAMKQALEALETVTVDVKTTPNAYEASRQAITALRAAIEQPRQWQGLTNDEIHSLSQWAHPEMIEAIELKLKERNT